MYAITYIAQDTNLIDQDNTTPTLEMDAHDHKQLFDNFKCDVYDHNGGMGNVISITEKNINCSVIEPFTAIIKCNNVLDAENFKVKLTKSINNGRRKPIEFIRATTKNMPRDYMDDFMLMALSNYNKNSWKYNPWVLVGGASIITVLLTYIVQYIATYGSSST